MQSLLGGALAGMTKPHKVVAFLDVTGNWDPSLAFVMVGAIASFAPLYAWTARRERVAFGRSWSAPAQGTLDARLVVGAALFGVGWGLGGYCPGPALSALGAGTSEAVWFGGAMLAAMALFPHVMRAYERVKASFRPGVDDGEGLPSGG
jgi:uncharacterized membrane protein YedE/YeeE